MRRSLTVILAADIAAFSRLVEQDEEGTLAAQRAHRKELIDPLISRHQGRIANTAGDSLLVEFDSAVEAMRCATAIQEGMQSRNGTLPAENRIEYRIGLNVGDVVRDGSDLMGDAVNIAARLEAAADPGGIVLSASALEHIKDRLDVTVHDLGALSVKNISRPIQAYSVSQKGAVPERKQDGKRPLYRMAAVFVAALVVISGVWFGVVRLQDRHAAPDSKLPSIAVLPFDNISADPTQVYFADGLADDLITDLSKIEKVRVISRTSSFEYRSEASPVAAMSRDFGVRYVVEGSVRRQTDDLRITARVIDATDGSILWSERFQGSREDVFGFQDQIVSNIIGALRLKLSASETVAIETRATENAAAYDAYLDGLRLLASRERFAPEKNAAAQQRFEEAISLDPGFAEAYAGWAWAKWLYFERINYYDWSSISRAMELARTSIGLRDNALARRTLAREHFSLFHTEGSRNRSAADAAVELERAMKLQPNDPDTLADLAITLSFAGDPKRAIGLSDLARERNPNHPPWYFAASGIALLLSGDSQASLNDLEAWRDSDKSFNVPYAFLGAALALAGRADEARTALLLYDRHSGYAAPVNKLDNSGEQNIRTSTYAIKRRWPMAPEQEELFLRGLRLAGARE